MRLLKLAEDLLYPEAAVCCSCGCISHTGVLCRECSQELAMLTMGSEVCPRCGGFPPCRCELPSGLTARSVWQYRGVPARLVQMLKFEQVREAHEPLAWGVAREIQSLDPQGRAAITWLTMPDSRWRERSYDHAQVVAQAAAKLLDRPCGKLLERVQNHGALKHQVGLDAEERARNLSGTFRCSLQLQGDVILIDDVFTTGATAKQAAACLLAAGAAHVTALTITRAMRN